MALLQNIADKIKWIEGDLHDIFVIEDAMQGVDHVFHSAAMVSYDPRDRKTLLKTNVDGTANIVNIALDAGVKKMGYVSSIAALGKSKEEAVIDETTNWLPSSENTNYSISKFYAEQEVWRGTAEGLPAVIVNPSIILGSGYWEQSSGNLFKRVADGLKFYPLGERGFVDVRDVVVALCRLMWSDIENERYVLNGENLAYRWVFDEMAKHLNVKPPSIAVTAFWRNIAWRIEWLKSRITGKRSLITRETALQSSQVFHYSAAKLLRAFPDFKFTPIKQSIEETCWCYKETKNGVSPLLVTKK
jgi:nucleoside-diphosphate-sugar epimerase